MSRPVPIGEAGIVRPITLASLDGEDPHPSLRSDLSLEGEVEMEGEVETEGGVKNPPLQLLSRRERAASG